MFIIGTLRARALLQEFLAAAEAGTAVPYQLIIIVVPFIYFMMRKKLRALEDLYLIQKIQSRRILRGGEIYVKILSRARENRMRKFCPRAKAET